MAPVTILLRLLTAASVFAASFAVAGCGAVLIGLLPQIHGDSLGEVMTLVFALFAAAGMAVAGAIAGLAYALMPAQARDTWMACALGAGIIVLSLAVRPAGQPLPDWAPIAVALGAAAAVAARFGLRSIAKGF